MKTVLLAGGLGTRLAEETAVIPKPMVEIGGRPILWHILNIYAANGFREFVLALGYKGEVVKDYFRNFRERNSDLTVKLARGEVTAHDAAHPDWTVHLVDTGLGTATGGRLKRLSSWLADDETFMMTYGDGVADIDVKRLLAYHRAHGKLGTLTAVRPPARFGGLWLDGEKVTSFTEKPHATEGWINGGFFVLQREVLDLIAGDDTPWERFPLETLAARGELMAYHHDGFWQPMDTLREKRFLEELWATGNAPWKVWP